MHKFWRMKKISVIPHCDNLGRVEPSLAPFDSNIFFGWNMNTFSLIPPNLKPSWSIDLFKKLTEAKSLSKGSGEKEEAQEVCEKITLEYYVEKKLNTSKRREEKQKKKNNVAMKLVHG